MTLLLSLFQYYHDESNYVLGLTRSKRITTQPTLTILDRNADIEIVLSNVIDSDIGGQMVTRRGTAGEAMGMGAALRRTADSSLRTRPTI